MARNLYNQVVLIDDDPIILKSIERMLGDYFAVKTFSDPRKALNYFKECDMENTTLIMSDARMPYMGGVELLTEATNLSPASSRIILTGFKDFKTAKDAVNKGKVHFFLTKPVHPMHLINSAISAVEISKIRSITLNYSLYPLLVKNSLENLKTMQQTFESGFEAENKQQPYLSYYKDYYRALRSYEMGNKNECLAFLPKIESHDIAPVKAIYIRVELLKAQVYFSYIINEKSLSKSKKMAECATEAIRNAVNIMSEKHMEFLLTEAMESYPELIAWCVKKNIFTQKLSDLLAAYGGIYQESLLKVYTMGTLKINYRGDTTNLENQLNHKERMLLTYLLSWEGKRIPIDIILDRFWPDKNEKKALSNFYTTLYKLRKVLEPGLEKVKQSSFIKFQDRFCWVNYKVVWTDDRQLALKIKQAQNEYDKNEMEQFMAKCQEVFDIYRGSYLPDYLYEDWIVERRERLRDQWNKTMVLWVSQLLQIGCDNEARKISKRILEMDQGAVIYLDKLISPNEQFLNEHASSSE